MGILVFLFGGVGDGCQNGTISKRQGYMHGNITGQGQLKVFASKINIYNGQTTENGCN